MGEWFESWWYSIEKLQLKDFIEIIIIAYVIYRLYLMLTHTQSAQLIKGLVVILIAFWIASFFRLNAILFILSRGLEILAFLLIVLFQPELRKLLSELGENTFLSGFFSQRSKKFEIEELFDALVEMANHKIGAIIAIERTIHLGQYVEHGVQFDSSITKEVILSIFFPNSILHDGGMIIQGNRIVGAGCFFPLTDRQDLENFFGTRHRAAIGLSERTDALVLVVSEEKGAISMAMDGQFYYQLNKVELKEKLKQLLLNKAEGEDQSDITVRISQRFKQVRKQISHGVSTLFTKK